MDLMKRIRGARASKPSSSQSTTSRAGAASAGPSAPPPPPAPPHQQSTTALPALPAPPDPPPVPTLAVVLATPPPPRKVLPAPPPAAWTPKPTRTARRRHHGAWTKKFVCEGYPELWSDFLNDANLTDAVLTTTDGLEFPVHRVILAGSSPYFKSIFSPTPGEEMVRKHIGLDSTTLRTILAFCYRGELNVTSQTVQTLLSVADNFGILGIVQACCRFLLTQMEPANCLSLYKFSRSFFCPDLSRDARLFILHHFKQVLQFPEFLDLDFGELEDLLRDDLLNIRNEEMVFEAIRRWLEHKPVSRAPRLIELLQCVRFGLMSYRYFTTIVMPWRHITTNADVRRSLHEAEMFLTSMESRNGADLDLNDPLARPRVPYEVIFAIGGWSAGSPTSHMETYDARADRWFLSQDSDVTPRAYHGLVSLGHLVYMVGGFDGNDHFNTVRCYDPSTSTWSEKSNMHFPRCYISCCVLDGCIYALGGFNGRARMNSVERYDPALNQWEVVASMNRQRSDASACALGGKVYVAGGFNGQEVLNSVEVYDPAENQWTFIHPMRTARSGVSVTSYNGLLYAIGGFNGFTRLCSVESYNPKEPNEWTAVAEMSSPRSNFAVSVIDDMIFVIGGFNGTTTIPYVECFDGSTNEWFDAAHMNLNRSALAACVLRGLPNARDYSYLSRVQELLGLEAPPPAPTA